ncbi:hypothetical protein ACQKGL_19680 [Ensifer adhaerens]|uniref:hypothetical protein n=1 Tax=Ensifer adhaerens TaxID=106592 RepID=UPI003D04293B
MTVADDRLAFEAHKTEMALALGKDEAAFQQSLDTLVTLDRYDYSYLWSFMGVPIIQMPADVMATHLNHFSQASISHALASAGFEVQAVDNTSFPGAFFVVARRAEEADEKTAPASGAADAARKAREICAFWDQASETLKGGAERYARRKVAIYGAGFYGSWIYGRIGQAVDVVAFLDRNENMKGATHFGIPVLPPEELPGEAEALFIGLNPLKARAAIAAQPWLQRAGLDHVWL